MGVAMEDAQIERKHRGDEGEEEDPGGEISKHVGTAPMAVRRPHALHVAAKV
jgi:hypothetical protein